MEIANVQTIARQLYEAQGAKASRSGIWDY